MGFIDRKPLLTLSAISQQTLAKACSSSRLCAEGQRRMMLAAREPGHASLLRSLLYAPIHALNRVCAYIGNAFAQLQRASYLLLVLSPLAVAFPVLQLQHRRAAAPSAETLAQRLWSRLLVRLASAWWDYFEFAVQSSGPTAIKLMQWAAARPDLFPEELCRRLSNVHSFVTVHSWSHTAQALDQALGHGWQDFLEVATAPIGSGCIATVYRGKLLQQPKTLRPRAKLWRWLKRKFGSLKGWDAWEWAAVEGADVAIKVLHPDVRREVLIDLELLASLAARLGAIPSLSFLSPAALVEEFSECMLMQLDLRREAENLQRFRVNFAGEHTLRGRISFPEPIEPFISESVLVESFIKGRPVQEYLAADPETRAEITRLGVQSIMKMIFLDNFLHMDLHPGNVMVVSKPNGRGNDVFTLAFIDAGMVSHSNSAEATALKQQRRRSQGAVRRI